MKTDLKNIDNIEILKFNTRFSGTTLIELMIAAVMCSVAILGAMGFQYHTAADARKADAQAIATRTALSILETWRGTGGNSSFNAEVSCPELAFDNSGTGIEGHYVITAASTYYYAVLSHQDSTSTTPKVLNVSIGWRNDYKQAAAVSELIQSVSLTSYINN